MSESPSSMSRSRFVAAFGGVYEHSEWIAEAAWDKGLESSADSPGGLAEVLSQVVDDATPEWQLALLRAHPDLAGKLAAAGELTASSASEQAGAGLDQCTPAEFERFTALNDRYVRKFGFPFIVAVRGLDRAGILERFEARVGNSRDEELNQALAQVHRIARLRLAALLPDNEVPD